LVSQPLILFILRIKKGCFSLVKKYVGLKMKGVFSNKKSSVFERFECRARSKSGNWRYLESTANVVGNNIIQNFCTFEDQISSCLDK